MILPRLIRLRDAPAYLGMDRNRFNREVRPRIPEIPIGDQGIAFDRLDLDAWADEYKSRNGRPSHPRGELTWDANERQGCANAATSSISKRRSRELAEFTRALECATSPKRKCT